MESAFAQSAEKVLEELDVQPEKGLSNEKVEKRRKEYGPNMLQEVSKRPWWKILLFQFHSTLVYLLLAACVLAFATLRFPEGFAILAVLLINVAIGFFSELKAVKSITSLLRKEKQTAIVRREGKEIEINAAELVPGDIVIVHDGDLIPADMRIILSESLKINESPLTGEFVPSDKRDEEISGNTPLGKRRNMLYKGTFVVNGSGEAVVVATGNNTGIGKVFELAETAETTVTPMQQKLNNLARALGWITVGIAIAIALIGLFVRSREASLIIETAIALGIAAIPEGLPFVSTIALARGMYLMAKRNAIINRLTAVETLGATGIIFTDKTGTLTENEMRLAKIYTSRGILELENGQEVEELERKLLEICVFCNSASLEKEGEKSKGDPTEIALLQAGRLFRIEREDLIKKYPQTRIVKFDPEAKKMATYHKKNGRFLVAVKGAPEMVIDICTHVEEGQSLNSNQKREWNQKTSELASEGLRLLAIAYKEVESKEEEPYKDLTLLGLVCLFDPPRKGVKEAIDTCQEAGIRVVMVTGDQPETAKAIAQKVGIAGDPEDPEIHVLLGHELKNLEELDEQDLKKIYKANVFARVSPEKKMYLVKAYQKEGEVVGMTGDGINDAPALKKADIGVAMGIRGTEAAKQVADMILKDDAFETIVAAVEHGRIIFNNIRKAIMFMLCTNIAEVITISGAMFLGWTLPLTPMQILYLNVITDVFPALALSLGPRSGREMQIPPRSSKESILTTVYWSKILIWALIIALCVLGSLQLSLHWLKLNETAAVTISFLTLGFSKLWFPFNLRDPQSKFFVNEVTKNIWVWGSIALCVVLLYLTIEVGWLKALLKTQPIGMNGGLIVLTMSLIPFILGQAWYLIRKIFWKSSK